MTDQTDLFGNSDVPVQASLFGEGENRLRAPVQNVLPDPVDIRRRLNALLATARAAPVMPWSEREARMWRTVFPNMANWLPDEEADQLRLAFAREMERLTAAVA